MTMPYSWNPMPHVLDVRCGACGERATFEFAEAVQIRKADLPYFERSPLFEVHFVPGTHARPTNRHVALFYPGLRRRSLEGVKDLPPGYSARDWAHAKYWYRSGWDRGTLRCGGCGRRAKHALSWPADAYHQAEVRGQILWAFDRDHLLALRAYIAATDRSRPWRQRWKLALMKVPTHFLLAKHRAEALKKLDGLLRQDLS